jgi:hypothetical protein
MNTLLRFVALGALILLGAATSACTSGGTLAAGSVLAREDTAGASSDGFPAPNQEMVWNAAMAVVRGSGYVPDPNLSRADAGRVETRWRLKMHPFSGMGTRERVTMKIMKIPKKPNYFKLETNVMAQANDNIKDPSNPIAAEWTEGKRNGSAEAMLNQRVELMFLKGDVSDQFRRSHNMPGSSEVRYRERVAPEPEPLIPGFPVLK